MIKSIKLDEYTWSQIYNKIAKEYPPSVLLIRDKMKSVLGFTARRHTEWKHNSSTLYTEPITIIYLDFVDEAKKTFFLLKYSDSLNSRLTS